MPNKEFRPKGWSHEYPCANCDRDNRYLSYDIRAGSFCQRCEQEDEYNLFEAGASAMLAGLKKDGVIMENHNPINRTVMETAAFLNQCEKGILVFIPDDEQ